LLRLVGVDVSAAGFIARLISPRRIPGWLRREIIPWSQIEFFATSVPEVRLTIPHDKIARLHPADIAQLVGELAYPQANEILSSLEDEVAADTVESLDPALQTAILSSMKEEDAADILEEMDPDDAADALADMTPSQARELLEEMDARDAAAVEELLNYPEDSAGGIMTTDYAAVPQHLTTAHAIDRLRAMTDLPGPLYYVYVVDNEVDRRLVGVMTLRDLLLATPGAMVSSIMKTDMITARPADDAEEVARAIAHYDLLALPIVDAAGRLRGIVTIDDAMGIILPKEWKRRLPKIFG
jgi:Mg2+ transporter MgtE